MPFAPYSGCGQLGAAANPVHEGTQTNHLVTADRWGNVVSYTNTIEQVAGSGMTVPGPGFPAQQRDDRLRLRAGDPGHVRPEPARARQAAALEHVADDRAQGRPPDFAVGSPGGSTIITTVLQILLNHIDFGMTLPQAIAAPRVSQRNSAPVRGRAGVLQHARSPDPGAAVRRGVHGVTGPVAPIDKWIGNATGIEFLPGGRFQAAAEPVRLGGGSALVVNPSP